MFSFLLLNQDAGATGTSASDWTLIKQVDGVDFYYQVSDCSGNKVLLLRVVNGSTQKVEGHWILDISSGTSKLQFPGVLMPLDSGSETAANCSMQEPLLSVPVPEVDLVSLQVSIAATLSPL